MAKYTFYESPGHGWLRVPVSDVLDAGIENKIGSACQRGGYYYLEEDCDMPLFMEATGVGWGDIAVSHVEKDPLD